MDQKQADLTSIAEIALPVTDANLNRLLDNQIAFKRFLRSHLPSEAAAEDLLQQSLLKAISSPSGFADKENITAWFYRILRNSLTDFYRSRAAEDRKNDSMLQNLFDSDMSEQQAPDFELMGEICQCLTRLLPNLKKDYSDLVMRIDLNGEASQDVAESMGITYNNLLVRLHRARQALRKSLEQSCGACTEHSCLDCTCEHTATQDSSH